MPPGGPPQGPWPSPELYQAMGEENIFKMLEDFYLELDRSSIRELFPPGTDAMREASKKSAAFFVGLMGGPPLFHQRYGDPMMRRRHFRFKIDVKARNVWLECFERVLVDAETKYAFPPEHLPDFRKFLDGFSMWMVNAE